MGVGNAAIPVRWTPEPQTRPARLAADWVTGGHCRFCHSSDSDNGNFVARSPDKPFYVV